MQHATLQNSHRVCWMQDVVAKAPKFFIMYKRAGQRVIINHNGDMLVRPSVLEVSVQSGSGQALALLFILLIPPVPHAAMLLYVALCNAGCPEVPAQMFRPSQRPKVVCT